MKSMLLRLSGLKLKTQLFLMIAIVIVTLITIQTINYVSFSNITVKRANDYALSLTKQIQQQINDIFSGIQKIGNAAAYNAAVQTRLKSASGSATDVESFFTSVIQINSFCSAISLLGLDGELLASSNYDEFGSNVNARIYQTFDLAHLDSAVFTPMMEIGRNKGVIKSYYYIVPVYDVSRDAKIKLKTGYCVLSCRTDLLRTDLLGGTALEASRYSIVDGNGSIIASMAVGGADSKAGDSGSIISLSLPILDSGWEVAASVSTNELTHALGVIQGRVLLLSAAALALLIGAALLIMRSITRPVKKMVDMIGELGEANLHRRLDIHIRNELGIIASSINGMLDKIDEMTHRIFNMQSQLFEAELMQKETELKSLESQINPHFLYNTLECIRSMALEEDARDVAQAAVALGKIFRYSIKGPHFTQIKDEIDCMKNYMKIVSFRYMGKIACEVQVDEAIMGIKIVKMILQPILENAVAHGLENKPGNGRVMVRGMADGRTLRFEIEDDGVGMSEEEVMALRANLELSSGQDDSPSRSIGLKNIHRRIKHYYGAEYGVRIESAVGRGTTVTIELPSPDEP